MKMVERSLEGNLREGWVAAVLVAVLLLSLTGSLAAAEWTEGMSALSFGALAGMAFALLVVRVRLNGWLAFLAMLVVDLPASIYFTGGLLPEHTTWNEKVMIVETRVGEFLYRVLQGGIGNDAFIFVLWTTLVSFLIGYVAGWFVFGRDQPWGAILPAGLGLLINLTYAPAQSPTYLLMFLFAGLLLLVRTNLVTRQREWRQASIGYSSDIGIDFLMYGLVFSGLFLVAAWIVPPTAPGPGWLGGFADVVYRPWNDMTEQFGRMFSTLRTVERANPTTYFGQSLALGGPVRLGDQPVMDIASPTGRYWRATLFDRYTGVGWVSTANDNARLAPNDTRVSLPVYGLRQEITQTVTVLFPDGDLIVGSAQPVRLSLASDVRYSVARESETAVYFDIVTIRADHRLQPNTQYEIVSSISRADEGSLRRASSEYPAWIRDRYLQLPDSLPSRVTNLARQITLGATNNYDRARLIEAWLRANITYNDAVNPPPAGRDGVDYTLFDSRQGYCNYYASAMAVLARSVGIPARVASGYTLGAQDGEIYHVKESDAHSWPELFFPDYGWVEFEPTSSKPAIDRPAATGDPNDVTTVPDTGATAANPGAGHDEDLQDAESLRGSRGLLPSANAGPSPVLIAGGAVLGLALVLGVVALIAQGVWLVQTRHLSPVSRAFEDMFRFTRWLGLRDALRRSQTPYEQAEALKQELPRVQEPIDRVSTLYVQERYRPQPLSPAERAETGRLTGQVRRELGRGIVRRAFFAFWLPLRQAASDAAQTRLGRWVRLRLESLRSKDR